MIPNYKCLPNPVTELVRSVAQVQPHVPCGSLIPSDLIPVMPVDLSKYTADNKRIADNRHNDYDELAFNVIAMSTSNPWHAKFLRNIVKQVNYPISSACVYYDKIPHLDLLWNDGSVRLNTSVISSTKMMVELMYFDGIAWREHHGIAWCKHSTTFVDDQTTHYENFLSEAINNKLQLLITND